MICRLIEENNTAYAAIYLNHVPKHSLISIFDDVFSKKLNGSEDEKKASLGGLFFKHVKTFIKNSSESL